MQLLDRGAVDVLCPVFRSGEVSKCVDISCYVPTVSCWSNVRLQSCCITVTRLLMQLRVIR